MQSVFRQPNWTLFVLLVGLATGGCVSLPDGSENLALREDMFGQQEEQRKLGGRVEALEMQIQQMRTELDALRASQLQMAQAPTVLPEQLDELDRRLQALDAAREKDKQELIQRLSKTIADMLKASSAGRSAPAPRRSVSSTGYEHVVKPGETLSAIAQAYGVKAQVIIEANGLNNPDHLRAGQKLFIPE